MRGTLHHGLLGASTTSGGGEAPADAEYLDIIAYSEPFYVSFTNDIEYRIDGGAWQTLSAGSNTPSVSTLQTISFRGELGSGDTNNGNGTFTMSGSAYLTGNCNALLFGNYAKGKTDISAYSACFRRLFAGNTGLIVVDENFLPATTLSQDCYALMFDDCIGLLNAPKLPATQLASSCYNWMFGGCISLETAPDLPASTLASYCYNSMFRGCSSLNYVKMLAVSGNWTRTESWLDGVASSGTFVKHPNNTWITSVPTGVPSGSGIPRGWTVQTATS